MISLTHGLGPHKLGGEILLALVALAEYFQHHGMYVRVASTEAAAYPWNDVDVPTRAVIITKTPDWLEGEVAELREVLGADYSVIARGEIVRVQYHPVEVEATDAGAVDG